MSTFDNKTRSFCAVWHASGAREDAVDREARTHVHTSAEKLLEAEELLSDTTAFLAALRCLHAQGLVRLQGCAGEGRIGGPQRCS